MDNSNFGIEEQFWLSDAESMARIITERMGVIESYHQPSESGFQLTLPEMPTPFFRLTIFSKFRMKIK